MFNDADIEMLELEDAARYRFCSNPTCGDEFRRRGDETRCSRCRETPTASNACPTCDGLGFQAGAHTERVEPCPTCNGAG